MRKTLLLLTMLLSALQVGAITLTRVSVHDPSVVYEPSSKLYYIFGTHRGLARSNNMMNWSSASFTFGLANDAGKVTSTTASNANSTGNTFSRFFQKLCVILQPIIRYNRVEDNNIHNNEESFTTTNSDAVRHSERGNLTDSCQRARPKCRL